MYPAPERGAHVPLAPALRGSAARAVSLTLLRHLRAEPEARQRPSPQWRTYKSQIREANLHALLDSIQGRVRARSTHASQHHVPAQPHLLRSSDYSSAPWPTSSSSARAAGGGDELGVPRNESAHGDSRWSAIPTPSLSGHRRAIHQTTCSTRRWQIHAPRTCWVAAWPLGSGGPPDYLEFCADQRLASACRQYGAETHCGFSWI